MWLLATSLVRRSQHYRISAFTNCFSCFHSLSMPFVHPLGYHGPFLIKSTPDVCTSPVSNGNVPCRIENHQHDCPRPCHHALPRLVGRQRNLEAQGSTPASLLRISAAAEHHSRHIHGLLYHCAEQRGSWRLGQGAVVASHASNMRQGRSMLSSQSIFGLVGGSSPTQLSLKVLAGATESN